jgi:ABC-2 type transport system ATP-binding protein
MIAASGLTKFYGDRAAIRDLAFQIERGEIVGILGLNGAGKTTTLRILACLLLPSTGRVTINGLDVSENPHEIRKQVGFLPEVPPLYSEMTVESFLVFAGELRGMKRADALARVGEVLEITATKDVRSEMIANLSHGYRQRVGIGQAIIHQPPVLILDEPISGLDPVQIKEMREMIRGLKGRHTILVSSHILPEISQTCDRIIVIQEGQIVATGTEDELVGKLTGGQKLHLIVRGDREGAITAIKKIDGVTACSGMSLGESHPAGDEATHHIQVETAKDLREELARTVVQGGFGLLRLAPAEMELESIFVRLTQKSAKEARP